MKFFLLTVVVFLIAFNLKSKDFRVTQIPNGVKYGCQNCHASPYGGDMLTAFGAQVLSKGMSGGNVVWANLYNLDADEDGFTNGEELLDPDGMWRIGDANPGQLSDVTEIWNKESFPLSVIWSYFISEPNVSPNPSVSNVNINFDIKVGTYISTNVVDMNGNVVKNLDDNFYSNGNVKLSWNGKNEYGMPVPKGAYLVNINTGGHIKTVKVIKN